MLWGLWIGLAVALHAAAVLAAVWDVDLGEASAINDDASRVGGVVVIAIVPALIGATGGSSLAGALSNGYQGAMLALDGLCVASPILCVASLIVTGLFVSDNRLPGPRLAPHPRRHGCALPVPNSATPSRDRGRTTDLEER